MKNTSMFKAGYAIRDPFATYYMTFTVCGWIDLFTRKIYRDILVDSFRYCQSEKGLVLNAFVIMSNHVHLVARASDPEITLSDIIRDFKKHTHHTMMPVIQGSTESRRLWMLHQFKYYGDRNSRNENYQIWTNSNHPEECYSDGFTQVKINYIHDNPVRAGYVIRQEDYVYSSAVNYVGGKGIIEVEMI